MTLWYWAVRTVAPALLCSTLVRAQEAPTLAAGTRVRAIVPLTANAADPLRCESRVVQAARDTLVLSPVGTCPLGTYNGAVSALHVDHGSRWKHVAIGFASGAAIGGSGAASGLLFGAAAPAGKEWGAVQPVRVLRVGSVTLRPEIRLSLRAHASSYPQAR